MVVIVNRRLKQALVALPFPDDEHSSFLLLDSGLEHE